jgi:hypothetical protein
MMLARVMYPRPPAWISSMITTWPKKEKWTGVSSTIKPVTHTAEVDVKRASMNRVPCPETVESGN